MDADEFDGMPYGILEVDAAGVIIRVNEAETGRVGERPSAFVGRNFFEDVAPCTDVQEFADAFREGARRGRLERIFGFTFALDGSEQRVIVYMASQHPGRGWIMATVEDHARPSVTS